MRSMASRPFAQDERQPVELPEVPAEAGTRSLIRTIAS